MDHSLRDPNGPSNKALRSLLAIKGPYKLELSEWLDFVYGHAPLCTLHLILKSGSDVSKMLLVSQLQ